MIEHLLLSCYAISITNEALNSSISKILEGLAQPGLPIFITIIIFISAIIGAIFGFLGGFLRDYFAAKWAAEHNTQLEALRSDINRDHSTLIAAVESFSSIQQFSIERKIKAIEVMWDVMKKMQMLVGRAISFYDIFLPHEYDTKIAQDMVIDLKLNKTKISEDILTLQKDVEKHRPFLGELLWNLFLAYDLFLGRLFILITENKSFTRTKDGKTLPWFEDQFISNLLNPLLPKDRPNKIMKGAQEIYPYMASWALSILEQKILLDVDRTISGKAMSDEALSQINQISRVIEEMKMSKEE
jgi:hypothetical protein